MQGESPDATQRRNRDRADRRRSTRRRTPRRCRGPVPVPRRRIGDDPIDGEPGAHRGRHRPRATSRCTSAADEAHAIVADALEQASLVIARAEENAERLLADAREDADREVADGKAAAAVLREQAEAIVAAANGEARRSRSSTAAAWPGCSANWTRCGRARRASSRPRAHSTTPARRRCGGRQATSRPPLLREARGAGRAVHESARQDVAGARRRPNARGPRRAPTARRCWETRETIDAELAEAREQTAWTKQTMADLLAAAEADAEKIRQRPRPTPNGRARARRARRSGSFATHAARPSA